MVLSHQPAQPDGKTESVSAAQIVGHFHPRASVKTGKYRFSAPCFCVWDRLLIMPAFGAYTGGISCASPAIRSLGTGKPRCFLLYKGKIWKLKAE
jgi:hypothetical protein